MQIVWTFEELIQRTRYHMSKAINASGDANWEVAAEQALKAIAILEIIEEVVQIVGADDVHTREYHRIPELLKIARESYSTYHRNAVRFIQRAVNHEG